MVTRTFGSDEGWSRRRILLSAAAGGAGLLWARRGGWAAHGVPLAAPLDPTTIPKYVENLVIPPILPADVNGVVGVDEYHIAVRQFRQRILPAPLPETTVWSYGSVTYPATFNYPAYTINARYGRPVRVTWINQLVDGNNRFLPHLLPVDPTLHWANPPGGVAGRDSEPTFTATPGPYEGPVPMVVHLHGGRSAPESDGYPEAWYLPAARDIPAGYATVGTFYERFRADFAFKYGITWAPGCATFQYLNDQRAGTEWFHDHTLGMTRQNVYAGPAGFYLLRGGPTDLPAGTLPGPGAMLGDVAGTQYYEIPIAIQDRSFNDDGSLFYPSSRAFFDGYPGPYIPTTDVPPIWNPEFFANTIVVNGRTWPMLEVEQRRYRFRWLNGCNARFLILKISSNPTVRPAVAALPIWQIGSDGGFLPRPVVHSQVLMSPAQRVDAIIDFTDVPVGTELYLINEGPDEPYGGGVPGVDFPVADVQTTGQVMKFVVVPRVGTDTSVPPQQLQLPAFTPLGPATRTRRVSLVERESTVEGAGPVAALLGVVDAKGRAVPLGWDDPITENPTVGTTEIWEIYNTTVDAHPIHVHEVQFQVVGRGSDGQEPPSLMEIGFLDTVTALPGEITRIKIFFGQAGLYVWHCHLLEHEDNEMMRPYEVLPRGAPETGDGARAEPGQSVDPG